MDFSELVQKRQSDRKYAPRPVAREHILKCLEAARMAPSACNSQPWKFVVVEEPSLLKEMSDAEICLRCECPPQYIHLKRGEPYHAECNIEGYEDHDGCVWNGEDEYLTIEWL